MKYKNKEDKQFDVCVKIMILIGAILVWEFLLSWIYCTNDIRNGLIFEILNSMPTIVISIIFIVEGIALIKNNKLEKDSDMSK